jgi:GH15 family glucan-1,4-alpha-glucosidase
VEHGTRNWDHRYCWLRHIPDALTAWMELGHFQEARRLRDWVADLALSTPPQELLPAYSLDGSLVPDEHELHALRGHEGARPVRVGNFSARQFQLDSLASVVLTLEAGLPVAPILPESPLWKRIDETTQLMTQLWRRPDHGVWDLRLRPEHYLASKVSCWGGIQSGIRLFEQAGRIVPGRWREESRKLSETIQREGFHRDRQVYTQAFGEDELDSSALLVGLAGLRDWSDTDMLSTLILLAGDLREGPLLRRNRSTHASPDFEGAHLLSTLWWCSSLVEAGRAEEAAEILHELTSIADPLALLGEGIDVSNGKPSGNFPSARVHSVALTTYRKVARATARTRAPRKAA